MKLKLNSKEDKAKSGKESTHIPSPPEGQKFGIRSYLHQFYQSPSAEDMESTWYLLPPPPRNRVGLYLCRFMAILGLICLAVGAVGLMVTYSWPKESFSDKLRRNSVHVAKDEQDHIVISHEGLPDFFWDPMQPYKLGALVVFTSGGFLIALSLLLPLLARCLGWGIAFHNDIDTPSEPPIRIYTNDSRKQSEDAKTKPETKVPVMEEISKVQPGADEKTRDDQHLLDEEK